MEGQIFSEIYLFLDGTERLTSESTTTAAATAGNPWESLKGACEGNVTYRVTASNSGWEVIPDTFLFRVFANEEIISGFQKRLE